MDFDFKNFINENQIVVCDLNTKMEFLEKIAEIALKNDIISDTKELIEKLLEREAKGTTGLMDGFSIPHAQSDTIKRASVVIIKSGKYVEWESLDDKPVNTAISLLVPKAEAGSTHIDFLTEVSKLVMDDEFRDQLNKLNNSVDIYNLLISKL
ncbi:fructose PTS transporter subunit IIA [Brachyspira pilosicoli]|uniref:fructose PTS transporter subunit IIA n=1 Tax=Brachyspira pilosicoli TaxID=52584 RepID=UPI0030065B05